VLCGGSLSPRAQAVHVSEETKAKLLANAKDLKDFGVTIEVDPKQLRKRYTAEVLASIHLILAVADSLDHGVLSKLVSFLRKKKIAAQEVLRLRLDEPEKIQDYYRESVPEETLPTKPIRTKRKPAPKGKSHKRSAKRRSSKRGSRRKKSGVSK